MQSKEEALKDYYSQESGRRISAAMREKAERGVMPGCAPLGYKNAWVDGEKAIVIDPDTAPKVKRLFELAAIKKMSLRKLAVEAEILGLRSRNGKRFGPSALKAVMENPFYCGLLTYRGKIMPGSHEPLVTAALLESVQHSLQGRRRNRTISA
jgi:site-specific DNA recombinase